MKDNTKSRKKAPAPESGSAKCREAAPTPVQDKWAVLVDAMIQRISAELEKKSPQGGLHALAGDLLKLLAWQKEIGPEEIREVTVRWIGNDQESHAKD